MGRYSNLRGKLLKRKLDLYVKLQKAIFKKWPFLFLSFIDLKPLIHYNKASFRWC
jgi:hypothetical protein